MLVFPVALSFLLFYTEKVEQAKQPPRIETTSKPAKNNRKKLCKPNETKTRYTLVKDTIILYMSILQAASSQRTHVARIQGYAVDCTCVLSRLW